MNELRELVQYYEQTSDMMVDAVNENVKEEEDDEEEEEEDETEDGSMFDAMFDSEQENRHPVTNIRCVNLNKYIVKTELNIKHLINSPSRKTLSSFVIVVGKNP